VLGSFRLIVKKSHLHDYFNFTGNIIETVGQSLVYSARHKLNVNWLRYLWTVIVTAAVYL